MRIIRGVYTPYALLKGKKITVGIPITTIDGLGSAGRGTLYKAVAEALDQYLLDSDVIYRVLALAALHHYAGVESEEALMPLAAHPDVHFISTDSTLEVVLEGEDVSGKIRTQEVAGATSKVAAFPRVREVLLRHQRTFHELPRLIADGRDIGTVAFLDMLVKIFLDASADE